jgi:opacity protein-like surface antigen
MRQLLPGLILAASCAISAHSQATPTAYRTSDLAVFFEYQSLHTDYGGEVHNGIIGGLDYSRYFLNSLIVPSLELRANYAAENQLSGEQVALGGVRLDLRLRSHPRLHPYANFLIGAGQIDFVYTPVTPTGVYTRDNSTVFNYGAGASYGIGHGLELQAEFQHQNWNISPGSTKGTLTPASIDAGVRYHVHFPSFHRR